MFQKVLRDIKSLKIQGAENIARTAVKSLYHIIHHTKASSAKELLSELKDARDKLIFARATEPTLRNALNFVMRNLDKDDIIHLISGLDKNIKDALDYFEDAERKIAEIGSKKIKKGMVIFTHCHSSTVMMILAKSKFSRIRFSVHNTETRPRFQGRITAKELSALGIPVSHYVDSAARLALKKTDMFLFGADAVQSDGRVINKIGTELFLEIAKKYDIPCYSCMVSWKFDPKTVYGIDEPIENRNPNEVWDKRPKGVTIMNPAFEICEPELITGIISELGVFRPEVFVDEVMRSSPWMFG